MRNELIRLYGKLNRLDRASLHLRARVMWLRRHPRWIPLYATLAVGAILPALMLAR